MTSKASITIIGTNLCSICMRRDTDCDLRRCETCNAPICDRRPGARCCGGPCRAKASRRRRGIRYVPKAHSAPAIRVKRAPDLRVSYRKAVEALAATLSAGHFHPLGRCDQCDKGHRARAERILAPLLSPAAQQHLGKDT